MSDGDTNAPKEASPALDTALLSAKPTLPQRLAGAGILGGSAALGVLLSGDTHQFDPVMASFALDPAKAGLVAGLAASGLSAYPLRVFEAVGSSVSMLGRGAYGLADRIRRYAKNEAARVDESLSDSDKGARRHGNRRIGLGLAAIGLVSAMAAVQHYVGNPNRRFFGTPMTGIGKGIDDGVASLLGANHVSSSWNDGQRNKAKNVYHIAQGVPSIADICSDIPLPPQMSALPSNATWDDYTHLKNAWKNSLEHWARGQPLALKWTPTPATNLVSHNEYAEDPLYEVFIMGLDNSRILGGAFVFYDGRLIDTTYRFKDLPHTYVSMYPSVIDDEFFITYDFTKSTLEGGTTYYVRDVLKSKGYGPFIADTEEDSLETAIWDDASGPQSPGVYVGRGGRPEDNQEMRFLYLVNSSRDVRRIPLVDED